MAMKMSNTRLMGVSNRMVELVEAISIESCHSGQRNHDHLRNYMSHCHNIPCCFHFAIGERHSIARQNHATLVYRNLTATKVSIDSEYRGWCVAGATPILHC